MKTCSICGTEWPDDSLFCAKDGTTLRADSSADGLIGTVVADRYRIVSKLGEGGMGAVYLGEHVKIGRKSAIKVMTAAGLEDPQALARFNREAANAARITHPNVCSIYDFGETADGVVYIAMEYIEGESLKQVMAREGRLGLARAAEITRQVGNALRAANELGIVHRDLKPDNIIVTRQRDGADVVKVVDFGIAKAMTGDDSQDVTATGLLVGTPEYMSPEQVAGDAVDGRSDIYSLGLVFYRMITGEAPFSATSSQDTMIARLTSEPRRLGDAMPASNFPIRLQQVMDRALARVPDARYSTAEDFTAELIEVVTEAVGARTQVWTSGQGNTGAVTRPMRKPPQGPALGNNLHTFSYFPDDGWSVKPFPAIDSPQTLVLAFGAPEYMDTPAPITELAAAFPTSHVVGCSSAGEIFGTEVFDGSLVVAAMRFKKAKVAKAVATIASADDSEAVGASLARELHKPDLRAVLVLSDGIHVNGTELVRGLNSVLPPTVVVTGGLAGDGPRFKRTWVIADGAPQADRVVAVGLYGSSLILGHGSRGGWDIFGPERVVTRAHKNTLYELDGKPALGLYKHYLGDRASGLPATGLLFPLALRESRTDEKRLVRTILAVDEAEQSMTFAGDVPQGAMAQFMKANFDRVIDGAAGAAQLAQDSIVKGMPGLAVAISCVGRRLVLGERSEEETEATLDAFPPGTRQVGFYSYGEISPYTTGHCDLHNQTMTLTFISEQ